MHRDYSDQSGRHLRYVLLVCLFAALFALPFRDASAAKVPVGASDTINYLQGVKLTGPKGEKLYLGYKTSITMFILGVWYSREGYVLGIQGDDKRYFILPEGDELARFQKAGLLPDPLPKYESPIIDYVFGYSLWLVIAAWIFGAWAWGKWKNRNSTAQQAESLAVPAGDALALTESVTPALSESAAPPPPANTVLPQISAKELFEAHAADWVAKGKPAGMLAGGTLLLTIRCWTYSDGCQKEGASDALLEFIRANELALGPDWLDKVTSERENCRACGESYRVDNLAICTHCMGKYCHRCKRQAGYTANGNAACRCGGELVG